MENNRNQPIYDGHLHTHGKPGFTPEEFVEKTQECGVVGGTVFSVHPARYRPFPNFDQRAESRIDKVMEFTSRAPGFLPYFFCDLSEPDALRHVEYARKAGIRGFKVICDGDYSVSDHLEVIQAMADTGLPVMFHSGVDNIPHISSRNVRPMAFEPLLKVKGLRFSLAHIGWPWCDEFVGTMAKFMFARSGGLKDAPEFFTDVTPGTPGIYRREAMRKLYLTGFDVRPCTFWGTDQVVNSYNPDLTRRMLARDRGIAAEIERDAAAGVVSDPYGFPKLENLEKELFAGAWRRFNAVGDS